MSHLTWQEAQSLGVILEVNRRLLHPRGLALEIATSKNPDERVLAVNLNKDWCEAFIALLDWAKTEIGEQSPEWQASAEQVRKMVDDAIAAPDVAHLRIQDYRDDPEGMYFGDLDEEDTAKALRFIQLCEDRTDAREAALGYTVEPLA